MTALALYLAVWAAAPSAWACPDGSPVWMGLRVCQEKPRDGYDRTAFGAAYRSLEDEIIDHLPQSDGAVYTPYTCTPFDIRTDGTAATDIEHVVALREAWDSGLAAPRFRAFAGDIDNLTVAAPSVNRSKSDRDAGEWRPPSNGAWFAARTIAVKRKYGLSIDPREREALRDLAIDAVLGDWLSPGQGGRARNAICQENR